MIATRMRDKATIERPSGAKDGQGGFSDTWLFVAEVFAHRRALKPSESFYQGGKLSGATHEVVIRHRKDIRSNMRLRFEDGAILYVKGRPLDVDGRNRFLTIRCEESN